MFKSVLVIILVIGVLWLSRVFMQRLKQPPGNNSTKGKDTVKCLQCNTYIPREDAIMKDGQAFCSQQHLDDWNHSA